MKKFNIDKANKGEAVITKNGKEAKILLFDRDNVKFPLVVILENKHVYCFTAEGKFFVDKEDDKDLKMKP
jgi:hypothetical protein